jgi:transposase InsO family protein
VARAAARVYGSPHITAELRDRGCMVNRKRIERVMRAFGIVGVHLRRRVRTTVPAPSHQKVPDLNSASGHFGRR